MLTLISFACLSMLIGQSDFESQMSVESSCAVRCAYLAMNILKDNACTMDELADAFGELDSPKGHRWTKLVKVIEEKGFYVSSGGMRMHYLQEQIEHCVPIMYMDPNHVAVIEDMMKILSIFSIRLIVRLTTDSFSKTRPLGYIF